MGWPEVPATAPAVRAWSRRLLQALLFVLLVATFFDYPPPPTFGLDPSWSMALVHFFHEGLQFGPDVVFTYGPLGFLFSKQLHHVALLGPVLLARLVICGFFALVVIHGARRLTPPRRLAYFTFFVLATSLSPGGSEALEALYWMIIAIVGFELIDERGTDSPAAACARALLCALLAGIKFTFLIGVVFFLLLAALRSSLLGRWSRALLLVSAFAAGYVAVWLGSGQHLPNLARYLLTSWEIAGGYHAAMTLHTPAFPFWLGLGALGGLALYAVLYLERSRHRPGGIFRFVGLAAFVYLTWKQGFVRSDGHMLIFFVGALLPVVAFPALLNDESRRQRLAQVVLILTAVLALGGIYRVDAQLKRGNVVLEAPAHLYRKLRQEAQLLGRPVAYRSEYAGQIDAEKRRRDLPATRSRVGESSMDVLGYEPAIALYNGFTYRPRPVLQSHLVYTPSLARLNDDFYGSDRAPAYALLKIQTIDGRFPPLDDALLLRSFIHRYDYVHTERAYQLWKQRARGRREGSDPLRVLRRATLRLNEPLLLEGLKDSRLWATLRLRPSWAGHIRDAVYKLPLVKLLIEDTTGRRSTFRLTLPQAAIGFIVNPVIEDSGDYACFATGTAKRQVHALTVQVQPQDVAFFSGTADLELAELPAASSHEDCQGVGRDLR